MTKIFILFLLSTILMTCSQKHSQTQTIGPIELWTSTESISGASERMISTPNDDIVKITDISTPSITIFPAKETPPAPAVLIFPGGGYSLLAYDLEGTEIAQWLNSIGITAVIVKYSVPDRRESAFKDAKRAMQLLRLNAEKWNIDPTKIGVMGFSAGAHIVARMLTSFNPLEKADPDNIRSITFRPNFSILVYPAYLEDEMLYNSNKSPIPKADFPPTLIIQTKDDHSFVDGTLLFYETYKEADQNISLYLFDEGGHGYGLRTEPNTDISSWPDSTHKWIMKEALSKD